MKYLKSKKATSVRVPPSVWEGAREGDRVGRRVQPSPPPIPGSPHLLTETLAPPQPPQLSSPTARTLPSISVMVLCEQSGSVWPSVPVSKAQCHFRGLLCQAHVRILPLSHGWAVSCPSVSRHLGSLHRWRPWVVLLWMSVCTRQRNRWSCDCRSELARGRHLRPIPWMGLFKCPWVSDRLSLPSCLSPGLPHSGPGGAPSSSS